MDSGRIYIYISISLSAPPSYILVSLFYFGCGIQVWAVWIYREGIGAYDRTDQINYSDPKCQPGKYFKFNVSTP